MGHGAATADQAAAVDRRRHSAEGATPHVAGSPGARDHATRLLQTGHDGEGAARARGLGDFAPAHLFILLLIACLLMAVAIAAVCFGFDLGRRGQRQTTRQRRTWGSRPGATDQSPVHHPWNRRPGRDEDAEPDRHEPPLSHRAASSSPRPTLLAGPSPRLEVKAVQQPMKHLCPCLVVPEGVELVCAMCDILTRGRQELSFSIVDMKGKALSDIVVDETGPHCGIQVRLLDGTPLAWLRTRMLYERPHGLPEICFPSGQAFCTIARSRSPSASTSTQMDSSSDEEGGYELRDLSGRRLCTICGDFAEKAMNVLGPTGQLVAATERSNLPFDDRPHYQVRVAPGIDAGLVICGLLAVGKLEGGQ